MGRVKHRSILGQQIANILGTAGNSAKNRAMLRTAATRSLVCGGVALLVVAPAQVEAVGLGEIRVQSTLGRPLQAFVPMRVGTGETLPANCVKPGTSRGELTQPQDLRVASPTVTEPGTYNLRISTPKSLHEPMYELSLVINCPGTPVLVRHYVLMLDLPGTLASIPAMEAAKPPNNGAWDCCAKYSARVARHRLVGRTQIRLSSSGTARRVARTGKIRGANSSRHALSSPAG
jgi:Tfp pilus assembly protein FimV